MPERVILAGRNVDEEGVEDHWDGTCPNCKEPLDSPDVGDIFMEHGEFIAITQKCGCGLVVESFYDWDRTERKEE